MEESQKLTYFFTFRQLNASGPYNVPAGALADMSAVSAHYNRENQLAEEERVARMKEGKVVSLYD